MVGLSQSKLKAVLRYERKTGVWIWRKRKDRSAQWNARFVGKAAGCVDSDTRYWRIRIDDKLYYAHRLAFLYVRGRWPRAEIDHRNLDRSDCRWDNLREATKSQNMMNCYLRSDNTSGYKGVWFHKRLKYWYFEIQANKERYREHGFRSASVAGAARRRMEKELHGEFRRSA